MSSAAMVPLMGATIALSVQGAAVAQTSDNDDAKAAAVASDNGDIVVTATRQSQSISKVPLSISAYSQAQLDAQGVRRVDDVTRLTPGVQFSRGTFGLTANIAIRGIASTAGSSTTGIYIDDTPIQVRTIGNSSGNAYPAVFDLERVEVLRGPQGSLFGAGSEGGTVRFISPQPSLKERTGYGRAEIAATSGGAPSYELGAALGAPIIEDRIGFRISGFQRRDGGFVDRIPAPSGAGPEPAQKNANSLETSVLRGALTFAVTDDIKVTPSVYYQHLRSNDTSRYWVGLSDVDSAKYVNGNGTPSTNTDWFILPTLNVQADLSAVSLYSTTSYFKRQEDGVYDYRVYLNNVFGGGRDPYPNFLLPGYNDVGHLNNRQQNFTQEVRLQSTDKDARLTWVIGGFYTLNKQSSHQDIQVLRSTYESITQRTIEQQFGQPFNGRDLYIDNFYTTDKQLAAFGEASYELFDGFRVIAGGRITKQSLAYVTTRDAPATGGPGRDEGSQKETPFTPKLGLSWQIDPLNLVYATAAKGNRIGGVNRNIPVGDTRCSTALSSLGLTGAPKTYNSDSVWSYEIGTKNRTSDGRLRVAASAYYIKWTDIIRTISLPGCGFAFFSNAGKATSRGFDLQVDVQPVEGWQLTAMVGYNKATIDDTIRPEGATADLVTKGFTLGGSPWTVTLQSQYDFSGPGNLDYYLRSDFTVRTRNDLPDAPYVAGSTGYDPARFRDPTTYNLNLRAGVKVDGWDISAFANNVTNESPLLSYLHDGVNGRIFTGNPVRPFTAGLTVGARY